ncbi:AAA domain-containing protein [Williamsia sterculiae]|uniref:Part of AAA domain-containing protein n=1 Tax=Williamsia sterculiae TaxID=1344003 RepID=A0A1N7HFY6_9NOCA|nr:AAA domain-containing protein [Williamsia sterculiae]SIS23779.1 Part of AAA domain-containing protein [Williamsia sterculiae]
MTTSTSGDGRRARVLRLLQFLSELIRARSTVVRDVADHESVLWLGTDQGLPVRSKVGPGGRVAELTANSASFTVLAEMIDRLAEEPEALELVLAAGLLTREGGADPDSGQAVNEHLVTQAVVATHDHDSGTITVDLAADSVPVLQDGHLLGGLDGYDLTDSSQLAEAISRVPSVLSSALAPILERWSKQVPDASVDVEVESRPALVLRRRGFARLLGYYEAMIAAVRDESTELPVGLAQLVEPIEADERVHRLLSSGAMSASELVEDALYPLPSNVEQRDILAQLGQDSGVVVEGPPGTGKTHTIANLLSALLAKGQRVLVVSEKSQALRVLADMLPPELAELVVDVSDISRDGSAQLIERVETIAARKGSFQPRVATAEIKNLRSKRDQARAKREQILREIWQLRESETEKHEWVAAGYSGTAAQIVRQCRRLADRYDWMPGPVESPLPPLDTEEFDRLISLVRDRSEDGASRLQQRLPDLDDVLPDSVQLERVCGRVQAMPTEEMVGSGSLLAILSDVDSPRLLKVKEICDRLATAVHEVQTFPEPVQRMAGRLLTGDAVYLWGRVTQLSKVIDEATASDEKIGTHIVEVTGAQPGTAAVFDQAAEFVRGGGHWRSRFRKSSQRRAVEESGVSATVDGRTPDTAESLQLVADHLRVFDAVHTASAILADVDVPIDTTGSRSTQLNELVRIDDQLAWVSELLTGRDALLRELERISPGGPRPKSIAEVAEVARTAGAVAAANDGGIARRELDEYIRVLSAEVDQGPSPEGDAVLAALRAADATALTEARREWNQARAERDRQGALDLLQLRLRQRAPELHRVLVDTATDPVWDTRLRELTDAWSWRRAYSWAAERSDPGREAVLEVDLDAVDADIAHFTAALAAASAWRECLEHMTVAQVQALQSYRDHITNLGKGSGKHAERFRRAARSAMAQAQGAVPAWVMPIAQVVASVPPVQNSFDVVIVDEASQADITSAFLLWLAPRVIVVGDDRQCAPGAFAGAGLDDVFTKLDTLLPDMPEYMRDSLTPRSSLFSMLRTRFGHVVRLREHFRSMPEIIEFSSRQFYQDSPLVPVRQFGADRLPPLQTVFVPDAEADGENAALANPDEARELVAVVRRCADDPAYEGRSFGVVVLQGQRQVDVITQQLRAALTPEQWRAHRLRVGTPPDFQGDERHVVFLSMVVVGDRKPISLTRSESQRRFNVAASRAMDQLWLFHSVAADELKHNDLRWSLLSYMQRTQAAMLDPMPTEVPLTERVEPFESLFEQQIFDELVRRGFHVSPKVSVNNRTIDLVVTGSEGRMAVECDGDEFTSTPEQARADMERERELRRCGWRFGRVRESEYLLDPERALSGLWRELEARGVYPGTVTTYDDAQDSTDANDGVDQPWEPIDLARGD